MENRQEQKFKEYQKLIDLEKLKSEAFDQLLEFQRNNKDCLEKLQVQYFRMRDKYSSTFKEWESFKNNLEKKHKFEFPVSCYTSCSNNLLFTEFFKTEFSLEEASL